MSDVIDLKQFLGGFLSETNELLRTANANLLALESSTAKGLPNARSVRELYRALHTIKGLAGMVGAAANSANSPQICSSVTTRLGVRKEMQHKPIGPYILTELQILGARDPGRGQLRDHGRVTGRVNLGRFLYQVRAD